MGFNPSSVVVKEGDGRANAFTFCRLFFALMVIYSHTYPLGGFGADPIGVLTLKKASFGSLAVYGFFFIGGCLVTQSLLRSTMLGYFWKRGVHFFHANPITNIMNSPL